jgi:isoleucyl-tRNA synthetase
MPFQAEDIWQNTPEAQRDGLESILLSDWPEVKPEFKNEAVETEFSRILKLREIVTKTIEPLRADKIIGSSLEAAIYLQGGDLELLKKYEDELANIFITSQAVLVNSKPEDALNEYSEEGYTIYVTKALGGKCGRCWKYRELSAEAVCRECLEAMKGSSV